MKRFVSKLKFTLPVVALLASTMLVTTPAKAEWESYGQNENGSATLWYNDATGAFAVTIERDGKMPLIYLDGAVVQAMLEKLGFSNPDPTSDNNGKGTDKVDFEDLIKHLKGATWEVRADPESTPLGEYINGGGGGKVPHWNPGPDDDGSSGNSAGKPDKPAGKTAREIAAELAALNAAVRGIENIKGGMYDGSEGGTEGPPTVGKGSHSNHGQGSNGGGDGDGPPEKPVIDTNELGPKPELVNPPYFKTPGKSKTATARVEVKKAKVAAIDTKGKVGGKGKTDGKSAGGSVPMSPGLLGGSPGLGTNGLSSAGMAAGGMSGAPMTGPVSRTR